MGSNKNQVNCRELALEVLLAVTRDGAYSHIAIRNMLDKYRYLKKQERSYLKRVCEGTLEHMIWIDYVLDQFSSVKVRKMKPAVRCILQSSVYELKYMDAIPPSATCNEAVKLAKKRGFGNLGGFVNGVLRSVSRNLSNIPMPDRGQEPLRYLSVAYSMPQWILELWQDSYSMEQMEGFLEAFLTEMPTAVRVNPLKATEEELKKELESAGIQAKEAGIPGALFLENYDYLEKIPAFLEGKFYVQDISSMQAGLWAAPAEGSFVLDVCAAPGGKSLHAAELMHGTGMVEARDLTEAKVALVQENISRCQLPNIRAVQADARELDAGMVGKADLVIADLPCSGLGVLGRKADIKYKLKKESCQGLIALQREILHTVQQYVKPGGVLLYSTCTINPGENEGNAAWFLQEHPEFCLEKQQQILPQKGRQDGFFLARMVKGTY